MFNYRIIKSILSKHASNTLLDIDMKLQSLENQMEGLHGMGKHDEADNLEAEYEQLQYQADQLHSEGEAIEEKGEPEDYDESGLEDFFASRYRDWLINPELTPYQDLVDGLRDQAEREQYKGIFSPKGFNATDEQLFEAAKDAYETLLRRQKRSSVDTDLDSLESSIKSKYPGVDLYLYKTSTKHRHGEVVHISSIIIPKDQRGIGIGSDILETIVSFADSKGVILTLSPDPTAGGGKDTKVGQKRLIELYRRFGFVPNTGRGKDYSLSGMFGMTMYRYPKKPLPMNTSPDKRN